MIVDTSSLVAISLKETGFEVLFDALFGQEAVIPAPVAVEFHRVTAFKGNVRDPDADRLIAHLLEEGAVIRAFDAEDARAAVTANEIFGSGNGRGGVLNMLDLMVYGMAKRLGLPILCTGKDFAATDIAIHPASRSW